MNPCDLSALNIRTAKCFVLLLFIVELRETGSLIWQQTTPLCHVNFICVLGLAEASSVVASWYVATGKIGELLQVESHTH